MTDKPVSPFMQSVAEAMARKHGGKVVTFDEDDNRQVIVEYKLENFPYAVANPRIVKVYLKDDQ